MRRALRFLVLSVVGAMASATLCAVPRAEAGPPVGFRAAPVLQGLDAGLGGKPTAFAWAPDDRIFVGRKGGVVDVWSAPAPDGERTRRTFLDLRAEVNSIQGRGLLGLALAPDFSVSGRIFVLFTEELDPANPDSEAPAGGAVISIRAKAGDPFSADPATRRSVLSGFPSQSRLHSVGALRFGPDGSLYVSLGDGQGQGVGSGAALGALNLDSLAGKVLRIDPTTGAGVPSNPWYDPAQPGAVRSKVFARGFRNPYRFSVDTDGSVYVGDVGWATWEDVHRFGPTASDPARERSGGWPCYEGGMVAGVPTALPQPDFQANPVSLAACRAEYAPSEGGTGAGSAAPIYSYRHDAPGGERGSAVTAGPVYRDSADYPSTFSGKLFVGDYARDRIQLVDLTSGVATDVGAAGDWGNPIDLQIAPSGRLAFLSIGTGTLSELVYLGENRAPTAVIGASTTSGPSAPLTVQFSATGSSDPDGDPLAYAWDFGDGTTSTSAGPSHTFATTGSFLVTLTVDDGKAGGAAVTSTWIDVANGAPSVTFGAPAPELRYAVGDTVPVAVTVTDPQDGVLSGAAVSTQVVLVHLGHEHYEAEFTGTSGSFVAEDHGSDAVYYRLDTTATDSAGRTTTASQVVLPATVAFTLTSDPPGLTFSVDGEQRSTPLTWDAIVGGAHEIVAPSDVPLAGAVRTFDAWDAGGAPATTEGPLLDVTVPATATAVVARYASSANGISVGDVSVVEGASGVRAALVPVTLTTARTAPVTVRVATQPGSATPGDDYRARSETVNFPVGSQSQIVSVPVLPDTLVESDETFMVVLSDPLGAPLADAQGEVRIVDDDPPAGSLRVAVGDVRLTEGDAGTVQAKAVVSLSAPSPGGVSVRFASVNSTAVAPRDYTAKAGTLTFPEGVVARAITVELRSDGEYEPSEQFGLALSDPVGVALSSRSQAVVRIVNDDEGPRLSVSSQRVAEGDAGPRNLAFSVTSSTPSATPVQVSFRVTHDTTDPGDLLVKEGTLTIPAGVNWASSQVTVYGDTIVEGDERFRVTIFDPVGARIADDTGIGIVTDDDADPRTRRLSVGRGITWEGDAGLRTARFTVVLSEPATAPVTVRYATSDGRAVAGSDYAATSGTLTIPAGRAMGFVNVSLLGDAVPERDETFALNLSNASGATIVAGSALMSIRNDD